MSISWTQLLSQGVALLTRPTFVTELMSKAKCAFYATMMRTLQTSGLGGRHSTASNIRKYLKIRLVRAQLHSLTPASVEEICKIIMASPKKSSGLAPIPITLLKDCDPSWVWWTCLCQVFSPCVQDCLCQTFHQEAFPPERRHEKLLPCLKPKLYLHNHPESCGRKDQEPHPGNWYLQSLPGRVQEISLLKVHSYVLSQVTQR